MFVECQLYVHISKRVVIEVNIKRGSRVIIIKNLWPALSSSSPGSSKGVPCKEKFREYSKSSRRRGVEVFRT
ncbi:hypothetical protein TNCV_3230601 [Trichonephila clavipes]|nr:hypothetical protein TNCV_3230601 [Trichonephila clavipes]